MSVTVRAKNVHIMNLKYRKAKKEDASILIKIYNASFYSDYIRYGECPAYGRTLTEMEESIEKISKMIIDCEGTPIGSISVIPKRNGEYFVACLCIIPEYQGKGIGTNAINFMLAQRPDWNKITLITPADKAENIDFYTKKCGFQIERMEMDGNVRVVRFLMER